MSSEPSGAKATPSGTLRTSSTTICRAPAVPLASVGTKLTQGAAKKVIVEKTGVRPHWKKGYRVTANDRRRFSDVHDYHRYRLAPPPHGYRWVRADHDFLLIGVTNGVISSIIAGR